MGRAKNKEIERKKNLPSCNGCDFCGECEEGKLYLLGYAGKYYCCKCFKKIAKNWPYGKGTNENRGREIPRDSE